MEFDGGHSPTPRRPTPGLIDIAVYRRTDYEQMASRYDAGRTLSPELLDAWRLALRPYAAPLTLPALDLGSGTGLFSEALADWFDTEVIGVEPSEAMRRKAVNNRSSSRTTVIGGEAERIPLRETSCSCAWLSTVLHHIHDLERCAAELRRVLSDESLVLIRNSFGDRLDGIHWLRYWPSARRLAERRWPTVEATIEAFGSAAYELVALEDVGELVAPNLHAYYDRMSVRANSTLALIDDEDFTRGLRELQRASLPDPAALEPIIDQRSFLVFGRR